MGALLIYLLKTGLLLLFFYLFNRLILANETFHKFNRIVWLFVVPVSLLLPLSIFGSFDLFGWLGQGDKDVPALVIPEGMKYSVLETEDNGTSSLARVVTWSGIVYFLGMLVCLICYAVCYLKLFTLLRAGGRSNKAEPFGALVSECIRLVGVKSKVRLIVHSKEMPPFSWMRYIMVSEKDMNEDGREILIHELSHIKHSHSLDLILMDLLIVFQWFNPAVWLMKQAVQQVHEFQADDSVLRAGVNAKQYQLLLIKKAVGTRRYSMVNSFNHSKLKKRITMMWKKKSSKWAFAKCLYALPLVFIALSAFAAPEISGRLSEISSVKDIQISLQQNIKPQTPPLPPPVPPTAVPVPPAVVPVPQQDTVVPLAIIETRPLFANGQAEEAFTRWVFEHIIYPKEAKIKGIQGKVVVSYVLSEDGTVTNTEIIKGVDPSIDAEAIRVLKSSPKWEKPAMKNGKPVKITYVIPVNFQLREKSKVQIINEENVKVLDDVFVVGYGEQKTEFNDPLYIVNGAEVKDINEIDPNTIESIEVLKNELAVQKYGEKARNGVVIVKLK